MVACIRYIAALLVLLFAATQVCAETYAQKLGWPADARVLILHVDDAGMSAESNRGTILAIEQGAANSFSVMMPTPWVPEIIEYIDAHPQADAGLHLTLNAEWRRYRWGPLAGKPAVGSLVDAQGALWPNVADVVEFGTPEHVDLEIRAQLGRARAMGFEPTHLDSHMGTLFATPQFLARYIQLGVENGIPIMFPGGHNHFARQVYKERAGAEAVAIGRDLWDQGLPVLDDLHNKSYGWPRADKIANYTAAIRALKPGVTMMIMHCTEPSESFAKISRSGPSRYGDLEAMLSPQIRRTLTEERIVMTTWRELKHRRAALAER